MPLTIPLPKDLEVSLKIDADREHRSVEELASRRIQEAQLLNRIFSYFPADETRELRSLVRKRQFGALDTTGEQRFGELVHQREVRNAARLMDIALLARLRGETVRATMSHFGIRPFRMS